MNEATPTNRRTRGRILVGVVLFLVGCFILASNLGITIPNWWSYWPWLLIVLGASTFAFPGGFRERMMGYWLLIVGIVGALIEHDMFGLHWGNAWPIFIIAAGLRIIIGGFDKHLRD